MNVNKNAATNNGNNNKNNNEIHYTTTLTIMRIVLADQKNNHLLHSMDVNFSGILKMRHLCVFVYIKCAEEKKFE